MKSKDHNPQAKVSSDPDSDFDVYFEYFVGSYRPNVLNASREWRPAADMFETDTCVFVRVDIAGIDKQDVTLVLDKDQLILQGIRRELLDDERKHVLAMEVPYGPFRRVFDLPAPVCADDAKADYRDGFLTIRLQKRDKPLLRRTQVKIH
jgi:HSP20 family protein